MTEVLAALLGAVVAGIIPFFVGRLDKRKQQEAVVRAIAAEVATLCEFIRLQAYPDNYAIAAKVAAAGLQSEMMPIDAKQNYFVVYEAVAPSIGSLSGEQASQIARFYSLLKIAMDTARPDSLFPATEQNLNFMHALSVEILKIGDAIVQFPRDPLNYKALQ